MDKFRNNTLCTMKSTFCSIQSILAKFKGKQAFASNSQYLQMISRALLVANYYNKIPASYPNFTENFYASSFQRQDYEKNYRTIIMHCGTVK